MLRFCFWVVLVGVAGGIFASDVSQEKSGRALNELQEWLKKPRGERGEAGAQAFSSVALTKGDAEAARVALWNDHLAFIRETRKGEMDAKVIEAAGKKMKFEVLRFGDANAVPEGGRSLFISLHGGGEAPAAVNESQWRNQIMLGKAYKPKEGLYIAPRGPTDKWNLWHQDHIDPLFTRLIENCVALENVNPNRVYVLGYSAGGDGVYQIAPRMSDRWAAASMMAGHPNETQPDGLRNLPFALQVGEKDFGVKRNEVAVVWGEKLKALKAQDAGGYEYLFEIHAGKGHWMDLQDRKAIPWMEKYTRNPIPEKIVWLQDDVTHTTFYWLAVPKDQPKAGQKIVAERKEQTIQLESKDAKRATVRLNDAMINLDEAVIVKSGEKVLSEKKMTRTIGTLLKTLAERGDGFLMFSAEVEVELP